MLPLCSFSARRKTGKRLGSRASVKRYASKRLMFRVRSVRSSSYLRIDLVGWLSTVATPELASASHTDAATSASPGERRSMSENM